VRLALITLFTTCAAAAQTFDVASVKPAEPYKSGPIHIAVTGGAGTDTPTRLTFSNATLSLILRKTFDLSDNQEVIGPDWMNIDMFDIEARLPPGATKDQQQAMLQKLLAERFHMVWHHEQRTLPAYILLAPKGKHRLPSPNNPSASPSHKDHAAPGTRTLTCDNCTVKEFVRWLGKPEGHPVFDETGLTGNYDFSLTWEPNYGVCKGCTVGGAGIGAPPPPPPTDQAPPILSVAIDQQLGLRLERRPRSVDVLVLDHVDRTPSAN
jgi:uncharacterized protein (TIGR03435 family)